MTAVIADKKQRMDDFIGRCRERGVRVTPQRVAVFAELSKTTEHPDAETIYDRVRGSMPTISLDTVYRTLSLLDNEHLILNVGTVGGRARYDATTSFHYHFICNSCNAVSDIFIDPEAGFSVPNAAAALGQIDNVNIQLRGTCKSCMSSQHA